MLRIAKVKTDGTVDGGQGLQSSITYYHGQAQRAQTYYAGAAQGYYAGQGEDDHDHLGHGECAEAATRIFGGAAALADLGLRSGSSPTTKEITALSLGAMPDGSRRLVSGGPRVAYHDATLSVPKSVSVEFAALRASGRETDAQQLLRVVEDAANLALATWAANHTTSMRWDGAAGIQRDEMADVAWLMDTHSAARPVKGQSAGDPSLHVHCRLFNLARRSDGSWTALRESNLYYASPTINQLFEAEVRRRLEATGYATRDTEHGDKRKWASFELTRVPEALREDMCTRQHLVEKLVAEEENRTGRKLS